MSRLKRSACLAMMLLFALTGRSFGQNTPPIIWSVQAHSTSVQSVSFAEDGQTIVSAAGDEAKTWQAADGGFLQLFPDHDDGVISTDLSPDGQYLAVGYIVSGYPPGGVMDLWEIESATVLDSHGGSHVAFSPDGDIIASGGGGVNRYVYLHNVADGEELASYYNGPGYVTDVAYSPDGQLLAVANTHNTVKLWDTSTDTVVRTLSGHTDDVRCIAFSINGQLLVAGAGGWDEPSDSSIKVWRVADGELLQTLSGHGVWTATVVFHPSGQTLVSSGRDSQTPYSASMRFWRVSDGQLLQEYDGLAPDIDYAPDGGSFCYGTTDGRLVLAGDAATGLPDNGPQSTAAVPARLGQNYPNPFNPTTAIAFELSAAGPVRLQIYSATGYRIVTLVEERLASGRHEVVWNGCSDTGRPVATGVYFYRLEVGKFCETKPMLLLK